MTSVTFTDLLPLLPMLIFSAGAIVLLVSEVSLEGEARGYQAALTVACAVLAAMAAARGLSAPPRTAFGGLVSNDPFAAFVNLVVCGGLLMATLTSASFLRARRSERGEYYALLLFGAAGMSLVGSGNDLLVIFLGIEVMSVATYALSGYLRRGTRPAEAALKYFLLGAFSSALFLFGMAFVYGATGKTGLFAIASATLSGPERTLLLLGLSLIAVGFAFKVAAVPLHMWAPDVYEGAPTPVTAFMAVGVKAAAFAALLRTFEVAFGGQASSWMPPLQILAAATMIGGNLLALPQTNVKRMLAYSSVAHAGYLLVGVCAAHQAQSRAAAGEGVLFYLAAYTAAAIGAFAALSSVERHDTESARAWDLDRFTGLAHRRPALAAAATLLMLALAGVPPTVGFPAKVLLFKAAVEADMVPLAIVGVVTSIAGAYYYLRVVVHMYMKPPEPAEAEAAPGVALQAALSLAVLAVVVLGVTPAGLADLARKASTFAIGG